MFWLNILIFSLVLKVSLSFNYGMKVSDVHEELRRSKQCKEIIAYYLERGYLYNPILGAIISFNPNAISDAIKLDNYYKANKTFVGKLHCVPILVKDNIAVANIPMTGGIKALRYSIPHTDADIIEKLKAEGAIIIAKANLAEMAFSSYDSEMGGKCYNPWDLTRSCSRSSSGSGCGVAADLAVISIGTDTDGSIMGPASNNGVFGLRPAHNKVSSEGVFIVIESDDTIGPLANNLHDLVLTHSIMAGNLSIYESFTNEKLFKPTDIRIGYIKNFMLGFTLDFEDDGTYYYKVEPEVKDAFDKTVSNFKNININVIELEIENKVFESMLNDLKIIYSIRYFGCGLKCIKTNFDNFFSNQQRFQRDSQYHSAEDVLSSKLLSPFFEDILVNNNFSASECRDYCKEYIQLKEKFAQTIDSWYKTVSPAVDIILFPTSIRIPYLLNDSSNEYLTATIFPTLSEYASLSIPVAFTSVKTNAPDGLPMGMMLMGSDNNLLKIFNAAKLYEDKYLKQKKIPRSVPIITDKCSNSNTKQFSYFSFINFALVLFVLKI